MWRTLLLSLCAGFILFPAVAVAQFFPAPVNYGAGNAPASVYSANLDGDSDDDLAVANSGSNNISILLNNGDGTFAAAVNYGAGNEPVSVYSTDLDGDSDNDLAVANYSSDNASILLNNGDGTFTAAVNYGAGNEPISIYSADLDGDNDSDLAVANYNSDNVSILLNNGDGTFQTAVNYGVSNAPMSVYSADLDGDNDNDLAVVNSLSNNVSILINNGDGTFQTAVTYGTAINPASVCCVDLNGDSVIDLAVANLGFFNAGVVSILLNNGDGTFQPGVPYGTGNATFSVHFADLDGDSDNDLAAANSGSNDVSILLNNGDGTFEAAVDYGVGDYPLSVFCADLDSDSDNDLAVANYNSNNVSILLNFEFAMSINMIPDSPPISVPAGGSFTFTGMLTNDTDQPLSSDIWIVLRLPNDNSYGPIERWNNIPMGPSEEKVWTGVTQNVPSYALRGDYDYISYAGDYPSLITDSASFEFTVIDPLVGEGSNEWNLLGWFADESIEAVPSVTELCSNYPNPFNSTTMLSYTLTRDSDVKLEIYNLLGSKVAVLVDEHQAVGIKNVQWDASTFSSGIYFYKLNVGDKTFTKRMTLLK